MMKLTFTLWPRAAGGKSGSGVVSASGGRMSAHPGSKLRWGTSTNWDARISVREIVFSRCANADPRRRGKGVATDEAQTGINNNKSAVPRRRSIPVPHEPDGSGLDVANPGPIHTMLMSLVNKQLRARRSTKSCIQGERDCITQILPRNPSDSFPPDVNPQLSAVESIK